MQVVQLHFTSGAGQLQSGAGQLQSGAAQLQSGAGTLQSGINDYTSGVDLLNAGIQANLSSDSELNTKVSQFAQGINTLAAGVNSYTAGTDSRISVTLDGFHRLRSSVRSEKLSQAANTATVPNQCAGRTSQSQTEKPGRWVSPVSGTDWCSNASNKSWNPSVRQSLATTAMGSARIGQWSTQFPVLTPCCNGRIALCFGVRHQRVL